MHLLLRGLLRHDHQIGRCGTSLSEVVVKLLEKVPKFRYTAKQIKAANAMRVSLKEWPTVAGEDLEIKGVGLGPLLQQRCPSI